MNRNGRPQNAEHGGRCGPRVYSVSEIAVSYEGQDEQIVVKPPNLSCRGMFSNTSRIFPEGAVLNLKFRLVLTGEEIRTRGEVRHCQQGVGVGVEFIGLSPDAAGAIQREIELSSKAPRTPRSSKKCISTAPRQRHR
jgi:hypothetical protein